MKILRTRDVKMPVRGTPSSAGMDIFIPNDFAPEHNGTVVLAPKTSILIPAGIKVNVPNDRALIAFNKSGIAAKKNLLIGACVIDEDYQGEIHIDIKNVGNTDQIISAGDKITQLVCLPVDYVEIQEAKDEADCFEGISTARGTGGFGSTGTK